MSATFRPSRRFILKQATAGAVALGLLPLVGCAAPAWGAEAPAPAAGAAAAAKPKKPLVV